MLITESHSKEIKGTLYCYDRVIIRCTAGTFGFVGGMTKFFIENKFKIFDFAKVFEPVTQNIKENAEKIAEENGIKIEYIRNNNAFRKEDKISEIIRERGTHPGLVHIFSALEVCDTYRPWHDKQTGQTFFKNDQNKQLHYYFYFIDELFGECFLKVPTIAPFKCVFYFNGHNYLEHKLKKHGIEYEKHDNAFVNISDFDKAQELSDNFKVEKLHSALDAFMKRYCPLPWDLPYNYTLSQVEYSLDIVFKSADCLKPLYDNIIETAMHTVTPENIANFLGKRFSVQFEGEAGSRYNKRILGTRIKHQMGETSVKIYDKFGSVLRIEVTSNDVSKFRTFRDVQKKDGSLVGEVANVKKSIYSLFPLAKIFKDAVNRYLSFISDFDDPSDGVKKMDKVTQDIKQGFKNFKGFNFFNKDDEEILKAIADGKFTIHGITRKNLLLMLPHKSKYQISNILKRLRVHGLLRKVGKSYKYYLTSLARKIIISVFAFKNLDLTYALASS